MKAPGAGRPLATALLGIGLIAGAAAFGTVSLYLPGVALVVLAVGSRAWVGLAVAGASVERLRGPATVQEGQIYPLRLRLHPGLLTPPTGELVDPLLSEPVAFGGRAPDRARIDVRFARRGRRTIEPGVYRIADPLGISVRELAVDGEQHDLLVLPRIEPLLSATASGGAAGGAVEGDGASPVSRRRNAMEAELDLEGLRPYRQGTPASRIHWPAVARAGEMLERRLTADADSAPLVVLDASQPPSEEALDAAVRAAASICRELARRNGCGCLLPGERRPGLVAPDLAAWPSMHARLALVKAAPGRPPLARLRRAGAVIWVSARPDPPRELARSAGGGAWFVAPGAGDGSRGSFTVAGCFARRVSSRAAARKGVAA